jgi:hypothetical protein
MSFYNHYRACRCREIMERMTGCECQVIRSHFEGKRRWFLVRYDPGGKEYVT